ncbi:hypothetical protein LCGC14_3112050, partial [marine sediment metagenome]
FNINGMATDAIGVSTVTVSITRDSDGFTWDGAAFTVAPTTVTSILGVPGGTSTSFSYSWSPVPSDDGDQTYTIVATAVDTSDNADTSPPSVNVTVDRVAPSVGASDFLIDNDATYTADLSVELNSSVTDAAWMKFAATQGALATSPYVAYSSTDTTDLIGPDGLKVIWAQYADAALNDSAATSDTIILDTTSPSTDSVSPSPGAVGVGTGATVEVVFDETNEMDGSSITGTTFYLKNSSGTTITATLIYTPGTKTAELTPASPLVEGETYTAYLTSDITDGAGNPGAPYSWSFTTLDSSEPDASFIEPSDGSTITTSSFNINGMATDAIGVSTVTVSITRDSDG